MASLRITGEIEQPQEVTYEQLAALPGEYQVNDVSRFDPKRQGDAVSLTGLVQWVGLKPGVQYLGLHSSTDDFHASIPLAPILQQAFLIYRVNGQPLDAKVGGPFRFYIPNHQACHTSEIDECANVKFVDHIEFTQAKGWDNRPHDEAQHADLHARQA
jgi:DMSO/TMAO reductase YedYZ molybdopterin-dependent catalytic subunit